MFKIIVYGGE